MHTDGSKAGPAHVHTSVSSSHKQRRSWTERGIERKKERKHEGFTVHSREVKTLCNGKQFTHPHKLGPAEAQQQCGIHVQHKDGAFTSKGEEEDKD
ncbi:hypothetical protein VIGAN_06080100 [Vigna angularis var. angularis]|nr:hypothetical protein VIGAN_06080100 [Vigna angularis var. angularis]